jgi:hypothetical protein
MKPQAIRTMLAVTLGIATLLVGQLAIENSAWWITGGTATFDDPLLNAMKFSVAGSLGLALALVIGLPSRRPKRRL